MLSIYYFNVGSDVLFAVHFIVETTRKNANHNILLTTCFLDVLKLIVIEWQSNFQNID